MSNYVQIVNYGPKDALVSGDPAKLIRGTEIDAELAAIVVAITSKFDSTNVNVASGVAGLDLSAQILPAQIPTALEGAVGGLEVATSAEATALTLDDKIVTPLKFNDAADGWGNENAGIVFDLHELADPGDDRILFWDDSLNTSAFLDIGAGLTTAGGGGTILDVLESGVDHDALLNFLADEHVAHSGVNILAGIGLSGGGSIAVTRTIDLDISGLTTIAVAGTNAVDTILISDAGVMKQMSIQDMGVRVVVPGANQTFALNDANTMQLVTGATNRTFTIPTNASVAFGTGTVIYVGSRDTGLVTVSVGASVTLTSIRGSSTSRSDTILEGGLAAVIKVDTDRWMLAGDLV